ncbi:MAG: hypothetical protein GY869_01725, partial [Planctomycetes bacterium]|nr:hypothetical protein [Planctomycetota bacterium]
MQAIGSLFAILATSGGAMGLTKALIGLVISTAFSVLGQLVMAKKQSSSENPFEATPYTRREVGGTTPIVVGRRRTYGLELFRKNDSSFSGASSRQFFFIAYSVGPINFISDIRIFGEKNIFDLGHDGAHSSVVDFRYGTKTQTQTGFGWNDIAEDYSQAYTKYDDLGLKLTPTTKHSISYVGRAGINLFLAADEQGRNNGMNIAADGLIDGLLSRRFKDSSGEYICHVGDHNKYAEFYHDNKRYTGIIASGTYTGTQLASALQTAFYAAKDDNDAAHAITFTITYNATNKQFTIQSNVSGVKLLTWTGSHRDCDIYDELGIIRGQRDNFNPATTGGTLFDDIALTGSGPYSVTTYEDFDFEKTFTRNPIRLCYELRTNDKTSPGIEHQDDFDQDLMYVEEQYCNEIVEVNGSIQYDIVPRNVLTMLRRVYGDDLITGTVAKPNELLKLIDGSHAAAAPPVTCEDTSFVPQIVLTARGSIRYAIDRINVKTNNANAQSYKLQYASVPAARRQVDGVFRDCWAESDWIDINGGTISGSTDVVKTFTFTPIYAYAIRIINFSAVSGNFSLCEVELFPSGSLQNLGTYFGVFTINANVIVDVLGTKDLKRIIDGYTTQDLEFESDLPDQPGPTAGPYYEIRFPFKRRIGMFVLATNVGEKQSYKIHYQTATGGAWTELIHREDIQGTDHCFVDATEMSAFRIADMSRGDSTRPFTITEIEAYDAIQSRRYTLDAINEDGAKFAEWLQNLYASFYAIPCESADGKRWIKVERDEAAVQEVNQHHIITLTRKKTPRREKVNQWLLRFPNELKDYNDDITVVDDYAHQLRTYKFPGGGTGNVTSSSEIEFIGVTRPMQIQRMGAILKRRSRHADRFYTLRCIPGSVSAGVGEIVRINYPSKNISNKYIRIVRLIREANHEIEIEGYEHHGDVFDDPVIDVSDITFSRDAASGPGAESGILPGDVSNVRLELKEPDELGITAPMVLVRFDAPDDPNYCYSNIWVNWNAEEQDGVRVYRLESASSQGDGARAFALDTTGAI